MYTYLLINLLTVLIPLCLSFERKVRYARQWQYLFPAMVPAAVIFLVWDHYFVKNGIWAFNYSYLTGVNVFLLPIEEVLFFFTVPFSCVFIYEVVRYYDKRDVLAVNARVVLALVAAAAVLTGVLNITRGYTAVNFIMLGVVAGAQAFLIRGRYLGRFLLAYMISLLPFAIVNGILTHGIAGIGNGPVVWYNNDHNLGLRVGTIPVEDFAYFMTLFLIDITIYEHLGMKRGKGED